VRGAVPSQPYLRLTADLLRRFGAQASAATVDELRSTHWRGPLRAPREPLELEPDASAAAVALAAGCLSGGEVEVPGLGRHSLQGDVRMVEYLSAFGCEAVAEDARLWARGFPMRAVDLDLLGEPDLAPVLAAVAAALALRDPRSGRTRLRGLQTLAGKESDRLGALAEALAQLGLAVERGAAELSIAPPSGAPPSGEWILDSRGDHRLAFAFAVLGLVREGVRVRGAGAVAKSWPTFWRDLRSLSAPDAPRG
jgi:3-phosphoshikimate 1-carboxyvinyltransferase